MSHRHRETACERGENMKENTEEKLQSRTEVDEATQRSSVRVNRCFMERQSCAHEKGLSPELMENVVLSQQRENELEKFVTRFWDFFV